MRNLSGMMKKSSGNAGPYGGNNSRDQNPAGSRVQLAAGPWSPACLEKVKLSNWKFHQS